MKETKKYYKVYANANFLNDGKSNMRYIESYEYGEDDEYTGYYVCDDVIGIVDSSLLEQIDKYLLDCGFDKPLCGYDVYYTRWVRSIGGRMHRMDDTVWPEQDFYFERFEWNGEEDPTHMSMKKLMDLGVIYYAYDYFRPESVESLDSFAKLVVKLPDCCFEEKPGWWFSCERLKEKRGEYVVVRP